ncbi:hypothetical protein [Streptomyces sp. HUAS ZL42]
MVIDSKGADEWTRFMRGQLAVRALTAYNHQVRPKNAWLDGGVVDSPSP